MEKLVSVFINAYNSEDFILETVNSVLNQTYKNIQLIVVDDCSTDKTYELLKTIDDSRLELYQNARNQGIVYTCNRGIDLCRGQYIAHTDSDDIWMPDKLEKQFNFLENHPEYTACFSWVDVIDSKGNPCQNPQPDFKTIFSMDNMQQADMFRYFLENPNRICHSSMFARAKTIKSIKHHRPSTRYLHDYDCWVRMLLEGPIYIINEPLLKYRVHTTNNSAMDESKWIAHDTELLYIIDSAIENCSDDLFLNAFGDKLRFSGNHTHEEVQLEKAFYSADNIYRFNSNPILAINRLMRLFDSDEKYVKLAEEKFGFTAKDLNKLQTSRIYATPELIEKQKQTIDQLLEIKDSQEAEIKRLDDLLKSKDQYADKLGNLVQQEQNNVRQLQTETKQLQTETNQLKEEIQALNERYSQIQNSFSWKVTAPLRKIKKLFKRK